MTHKQKHLKKNRLPNWVIVALVLIGSVLLTWMMSAARLAGQVQKDREGFQKAEATAASVISLINEKLGMPLYDDRAHFCMFDAVGKDPTEKLFCDTLFSVYYRIDPEAAEDAIQSVKQVVEQTYDTTLIASEYNFDIPIARLRVGSHKIEKFNGLDCAVGISYPQRGPSNSYLPDRNFDQEYVLSISAHCDKHVAKRVY